MAEGCTCERCLAVQQWRPQRQVSAQYDANSGRPNGKNDTPGQEHLAAQLPCLAACAGLCCRGFSLPQVEAEFAHAVALRSSGGGGGLFSSGGSSSSTASLFAASSADNSSCFLNRKPQMAEGCTCERCLAVQQWRPQQQVSVQYDAFLGRPNGKSDTPGQEHLPAQVPCLAACAGLCCRGFSLPQVEAEFAHAVALRSSGGGGGLFSSGGSSSSTASLFAASSADNSSCFFNRKPQMAEGCTCERYLAVQQWRPQRQVSVQYDANSGRPNGKNDTPGQEHLPAQLPSLAACLGLCCRVSNQTTSRSRVC